MEAKRIDASNQVGMGMKSLYFVVALIPDDNVVVVLLFMQFLLQSSVLKP